MAETDTTRFQLRRWSADTPDGPNRTELDTAHANIESWAAGWLPPDTLANRPVAAARYERFLYYATDNKLVYYCRPDGLGGFEWVQLDPTLPVWIAAADLEISNGAPTLATIGDTWPYWSVDDATTEGVVTVTQVPTDWATYDVDLWWIGNGGGANNVLWRVAVADAADGSTLGAGTLSGVTAANPGSNILEVTRLVTGQAVPASGNVTSVRIVRGGGDALDTLAGDVGILGVLLTKAS